MAYKKFEAVDGHYPLYARYLPDKKPEFASTKLSFYVDMNGVSLPTYQAGDNVPAAAELFDARAARFIQAASIDPEHNLLSSDLYGWDGENPGRLPLVAPIVVKPRDKCLAVLASADFFDVQNKQALYDAISNAILQSNPGWCGTFGPGVDSATDLLGKTHKGDYDMTQMHLLHMAYAFYDELTPAARDLLINVLLATGRIHRPGTEERVTSGKVPHNWALAGSPTPAGITIRVGETENHILMMHTVRYLTNQLLYQRDHDPDHDNRRNGSERFPTCMRLMLFLLRNILRDDFSEYNAKPYQTQVRLALLNLYNFAYDHEVRLAAQMALDYISANRAVSSNDLRRIVPFRRINEDKNTSRINNEFMTINLLETAVGADPSAQHYALLAGNVRIYILTSTSAGPSPTENGNGTRLPGYINTEGKNGNDALLYAVGKYRLPPSILDLFVNDASRRFYQRLRRTPLEDPEITARNCTNYEIYASSPSYLITAGGSPSPHAIDPHVMGVLIPDQQVQLGVAMPTTFMPTTRPALDCGDPTNAYDLIQFGHFSYDYDYEGEGFPGVHNYGVAPDFACGYKVHLPDWVLASAQRSPLDESQKFLFVDKGSDGTLPGFYLAIYQDENFACMEAFDTWLHHNVNFATFVSNVIELNGYINLRDPESHGEQGAVYTTQNGNKINFLIWTDHTGFAHPDAAQGASILSIQYHSVTELHTTTRDANDRIGDAGNATDKFLNGTILNSEADGRIVITNPSLGSSLTLDMTNPDNPFRISEDGELEETGFHNEVWVNSTWQGDEEGDFYHPFRTIESSVNVVAENGNIKLMPGVLKENIVDRKAKKIRITAPIGGVIITA